MPASRLAIAARVIGSGVVKSGSPMVRLMTSFISASMSKKRRMPDGGMARTRSFRKSAVGRGDWAGCVVIRPTVYRGEPSRLTRRAGLRDRQPGNDGCRRRVTRAQGEAENGCRDRVIDPYGLDHDHVQPAC